MGYNPPRVGRHSTSNKNKVTTTIDEDRQFLQKRVTELEAKFNQIDPKDASQKFRRDDIDKNIRVIRKKLEKLGVRS